MRLIAFLALAVSLASLVLLERERSDLSVERITVGDMPVTLWRPADAGPLPLVVVAHGYAGSRQMMRAFAVTLARSGLAVAAVDLPGHGRHPRPMTGDVTRLDGATAMLTREVVAATRALRTRDDIAPELALLGHSMATDIVIRAAQELPADAVVAVSMYSEAVTPEAPARLLILSGEREGRLREVAVDALRQVDPAATEGQTATAPGVIRRAVAAPVVGHVGVLYAQDALAEARDWIGPALGVETRGRPPMTALWLTALLGALLILAWPLAGLFGPPRPTPPPLPRRAVWGALLLPVPPALLAAVFLPDIGGLLAIAPLTAFLGIWGGVQILLLHRAGARLGVPRPLAALVFAVWAFGLFALALDRYGASFLPLTGLRIGPALALLPAALLFSYGDALLTQGAGWVVRLAARVLPIAALLGAMLLDPPLGVAFTVLPVLLLFWLVFGTAGRWMAARAGAASTAPILGAMLAWALAASTPMIAG